MASKTFTLGEEKRSICVKVLLVSVIIAVLITAIVLGFYAFKSDGFLWSGCIPPVMDPNGLSNWTYGAQVVAIMCLGDHSSSGGSGKVSISECVNNQWVPEPPACIDLPIHLECPVDINGLEGTIHMWQITLEDPLRIYGRLSTVGVDKTAPIFTADIPLSRSTCKFVADANMTGIVPEESSQALALPADHHDTIEIRIKSLSLVAYKSAELKIVMVFIDSVKTATLVSVTQEGNTAIMHKPNGAESEDWTLEGQGLEATSAAMASAAFKKLL